MKKLVLAVLSVVAVFAALGTTTFAWFTLSGSATVGTIEVNVESGIGIELSLDGTNWKPNFTTAEIEAWVADPAGGNYKNSPAANPTTFSFGAVKLTAVTPTAKALGNMAFQKIKLDGSYDAATVRNKDYIEFPLYIRVKGASTQIKWVQPLTNDTVPIAYSPILSGGVEWTADAVITTGGTAPVTTAVGTKYVAAAQNAARVSVGHTIIEAAPDAVGSTVGTKLPNDALGNGSSLDLSKGAHQYFNIKHPGVLGSGTIIADAKTLLAGWSETPATDAWQVKNVTDIASGYVLDETLTAGANDWRQTGLLNVRIWLEGWDFDCFDAIYADNLNVNLRFEAATA